MTRPLDVARWLPWLRDRTESVSPASGALSVTYPTTRLVSRVMIALGADLSADPASWQWADITPWVRFDLGISLTTGRRDEASTVTTGSATLKLDNRDSRFTRRNPTGPYFGLLSKNTPIWATVDAGSGEKTRLEMFVNEWPKSWADKSATDSTVTIQCAGVLRRLAQGRVLKSALRRAILADAPGAYWPLEDGSDATSGASATTSNANAMGVATGTITWAGRTGPAGSGNLPDFTAGGKLAGNISGTAFDSSTSWTVELIVNVATAATTLVPIRIFTEGSFQRFYVQLTAGFVSLNGFLTDGTFVPIIVGIGTTFDDQWHHLRITATQSGANIACAAYLDGVSAGTGTASSATLGKVTSVDLNSDLSTSGNGIGHVAVFDSLVSDHSGAVDGHSGELAHVRLARLCSEEGILFQALASTSATMGPQTANTLPALLRECEAADGGTLYEKRWGLAYQALSERYNVPVGLALDIAQGHLGDIPEPADDDQRTRNLWTVSRTDGSEYTDEEDSGEMGTGTQGPGVYDDAVTLNVETDNQLPQHASWLVHLGTVDEDRWPDVGLNFARQPGLIDIWSALGYGARITIANPVPQMPPDPPDLIIEGHSEGWDPYLWTASLNCSPASPYRVNVVASTDGNLGRVDAANSTLAADATDVATTISVASTGALWRTGAVSFDINVAGERMTVTNISGGSSPQTFTVTRSVNSVVKAQPASIAGRTVKVSLWQPAVVAL